MKLKLKDAVEKWLTDVPPDERPNQVELAVMFGTSPATLNAYLQGKRRRFDMEIIGRACRVMGITDLNEVIEIESEAAE